jgi:NtrC-family two-component system sensor histidine kinase KinB
MVTLRHKLFFGFGGLLLIILIVGIQSISRLTQLGGSIDVILRENYRSIIACERMKEALERMDSGAVLLLLGEREMGADLIGTNMPRFEQALQTELDNITLPGEEERAFRIKQLFPEYRKGLAVLLTDRETAPDVRRRTYFTQLLPVFYRLKGTADEILQMNQQNMTGADARAKQLAQSARQQMYVLLVAGMIVGLAFMLLAGRWIVRPISRLTRSAEEIRKGNLELVVPVESRDEIGRLSAAFNEMAAAVREFRRSDRAKLHRIQRATQAAFNSLPDAIAVVDLHGQVEVATGSAKEIFGLKPNAPLTMLQDGWIAELYREALQSGRTTEARGDNAIIQRFVRGEEHYFRPRGVPILDNEGHPAGVVLLMQDVTLLRQQDEMKRGAISTVSHQLKTPLTSIRMAIHLLLDEKVGALTPKQAELLVVARDDSERLQRIIEDLLDLSRMESGKVKMKILLAVPRFLAMEAAEPFRRDAQDRGLLLTVNVHEDMPYVRADKEQINHVLSNLLSNALRYTSPGGSVTVSAVADDDVVWFSVSDTGKGIPAPYVCQVFDKFVRVPGGDEEKGAGLGLAIVKEIVEAHGGSVSVKSEEGKGSTFTFSLLRADEKVTDE